MREATERQSEDLFRFFDDKNYNPRRYSGRGMFGRHCLAIEINSLQSLFSLGVKIQAEFGDDSDIMSFLENILTDQIDRQYIVYWPKIPFSDPYRYDR